MGEAGSEALIKINLTIKQSYKMHELNLLLDGGALNKENILKARILHVWSQKTVLPFWLSSYLLKVSS